MYMLTRFYVIINETYISHKCTLSNIVVYVIVLFENDDIILVNVSEFVNVLYE